MEQNIKMLQQIAADLKAIKTTQPNGELKRMETKLNEVCNNQDALHGLIMDPIDGLIVQTNKNTEFRITCLPERELLIEQFKGVLRWKKVIEWGLGVVFVAAIGAFIKIMFE